jgi:hypothetical protein
MASVVQLRPGVALGTIIGTFAIPYRHDRKAIDYFEILVATDTESRAPVTTFVTRDGSLFDRACDLEGVPVEAHWHTGTRDGQRIRVLDALVKAS